MRSIEKARSILSQGIRELSRQTGIAPAQWSRWFSGTHSPNLATLETIADKEGLDIRDLVQAFIERRDQEKGNARTSTGEGDRRGKGKT